MVQVPVTGTEVPLHVARAPLATTVGDLAPYTVADLAAWDVDGLGQSGWLELRLGGQEMPAYVGLPGFGGMVEGLTDYTVGDLATYTVAALADL